MILRNNTYQEIAKEVIQDSKKIIVYGAGMIGQIIIPFLVGEYNLFEYVECFVDMDKRKIGNKIEISDFSYEIKHPEYLNIIDEDHIILITNSKFIPILKYLDGITSLNNVTGYIVPVIQLHGINISSHIELEHRNDTQLIPKTIHYCWFGGNEKPVFLTKCIESWREHCPDYEIIEWNESNYDVSRHKFTKEAYDNKKYGFVTDLARLDILYEHGGIFMDTDVSIIKPLDDLLFQPGFIGVEKWGNINSGGGCGFIKGHPMLKKLIDYRDGFSFVLDDGSFNIETNGLYETVPFIEEGFKPNNTLQIVSDITVYPSSVMHPYDYMSCELRQNDSTVSIHHFYGGWMEEDDRLNRLKTQNAYQLVLDRMKKPDIKQ